MATAPRFDPLALQPGRTPRAVRAVPLVLTAPLIRQQDRAAVPAVSRRTKIWELSSHLHCSIVGTCLSTAELRHILGKTTLTVDGLSDHDLHGQGVLLARQHDGAGKLLQKALDKRHRLAISQSDKARTVEDVRALWRDAVRRGDIPGAYWATLTHPATTDALVREVFGEVHMLSHLVGAANRADIRRLSALEAENAALRETLRRQQEQLRDGIASRDARIRDLGEMLARRIAEDANDAAPASDADSRTALTALVGDLERRLTAERNRRNALDARLQRLVEELRQERSRCSASQARETVLRDELAAIEASLAPTGDDAASHDAAVPHLEGLSLLYVGGRANQRSHLRTFCERFGAEFLHHDGGIDDRAGLLAGLVSRADVVMFPVDCVSHEAVAMVKRLCRQAEKPYVPLRSAAISSFVAALARADIADLRSRADAAPAF